MYTIAGVAIVVSGAGVVYYLSDSRKNSKDETIEEIKRASKKERRKAKKDKEKEERTNLLSPKDQAPQPTEQGEQYFPG